jgi:hypothetical protein
MRVAMHACQHAPHSTTQIQVRGMYVQTEKLGTYVALEPY